MESNQIYRHHDEGHRFTKVDLIVPPGSLGIELVDISKDENGTIVSKINDESPLANKLHLGDRLFSINGIDVFQMRTAEILQVFQQAYDVDKKITVLRTITRSYSRRGPDSSTKHKHKSKGDRSKAKGSADSSAASCRTYDSKWEHQTSAEKYTEGPTSEQSAVSSAVQSEANSKKSHKHKKKHKKSSKSRQAKHEARLEAVSCSSDPPVPPQLAFDDSLAKKSNQIPPSQEMGFSDSLRKKQEYILSPDQTGANNNTVEIYPGDERPPHPYSVTFDDSMSKVKSKQKTSTIMGTCAPAQSIESGPVDDGPPVPPSMAYDDSASKSKPKKKTPAAQGARAAGVEFSTQQETFQPNSKEFFPDSPYADHDGSASSHLPIPVNENPHESGPSESPTSEDVEISDQTSNGDIEDGNLHQETAQSASDDGLVFDAHLVHEPEIVEAEILPEQYSSPPMIFQQSSLPTLPIQEPQQKKRCWDNKPLVCSIVLLLLAIIAASAAGIAAALTKNGGDEAPESSSVTDDDDDVNVNVTNTVVLMSSESDPLESTYFCGLSWSEIDGNCEDSTPCPSGMNYDCPDVENCIPFTNCGGKFHFKNNPKVAGGGPGEEAVRSTFYCGSSMQFLEKNCIGALPCPNGPSDCSEEDEGCFAFTECNEDVDPDSIVEVVPETSITTPNTTMPMTTVATTSIQTSHITTAPIKTTTPTTTTEMATTNLNGSPTTTSTTTSSTTTGTPKTTTSSTTTSTSTTSSSTTTSQPQTTTEATTTTTTATTSTTTSSLTTTSQPQTTTEATTTTTTATTSTTKKPTTTLSADQLLGLEPKDTTTTATKSIIPIPDSGNDMCENAISIPRIPSIRTGTTAFATSDFVSNLEDNRCGVSIESRGVWYSFESHKRRNVRIEYHLLTERLGNSILSLYEGSCDALNCKENREGSQVCGYCSGNNAPAVIEFLAEQGKTYLILLTGASGLTVGGYELKITDYDIPPNDVCEEATAINLDSLPPVFSGSLFGATPDFDELNDGKCGINHYTRGLWFTLVGRQRVVRLEYQLYSEKLGASELVVFQGSCDDLACYENIEGPQVCSYCSGYNSLVVYEFLAEEDESYFFLLSGQYFNTVGEYELKVTEYDVPSNDSCENAISANSFPFKKKGSTLGATPDFDESDYETCGINAYTRGVWYDFEGNGKVIRLEYKLYAEKQGHSDLSIFTGSCGSLQCFVNVIGNQVCSYCSGYNDLVSYEFVAEEGELYTVLLSGEWFNAAGEYDFNIFEYDLPENNRCENAIPISSYALPTKLPGNTEGATPDFNAFNEMCGVSAAARGVWYSLTGNGKVTSVSYTHSLGRNSQMSIFSGACDALECEENLDSKTFVQFVPSIGKEYRFLLTGDSFAAVGAYELSIKQHDPPENNFCSNAIVVGALPYDHVGDLKGATTDSNPSCGNGWPGVWFSFVGEGDGILGIELKIIGSFRSEMSLFEGSCSALLCSTSAASSMEVATSDGVTYFLLVSAEDIDFDDLPFQITFKRRV